MIRDIAIIINTHMCKKIGDDMMKKLLTLLMLIIATTLFSAETVGEKNIINTKQGVVIYNGPFGFTGGLSYEEIKKMVGEKNIEQTEDSYNLKVLPKNIDGFMFGSCDIDKEKGLVRVIIFINRTDVDNYGVILKGKFKEITNAINEKYGKPIKEYDFLRNGSIWNEDKDFMMGIVKKERVLSNYWAVSENENKVTNIAMTALAQKPDSFLILLTYEFEGFKEYSKNKEKNNNF